MGPWANNSCHTSKRIVTSLIHWTVDKHDDAMTWKHFPHYWPFVRGIHLSGGFPHKGPVMQSFVIFFVTKSVFPRNKLLNRQSNWWQYEMPWPPNWCQCYELLPRNLFKRYNLASLHHNAAHNQYNISLQPSLLYRNLRKQTPAQLTLKWLGHFLHYKCNVFVVF